MLTSITHACTLYVYVYIYTYILSMRLCATLAV